MRKKIILTSICLFMLQLIFVFYDVRVSDAADLIVVANKNVKDVQLTKDDIKAIFLGKKTEWSDSSKISFVVLKNKQDEEDFMKNYVGKSFDQFNNYWKQQVFTGNGQMPKTFENVKDLVDYVSKTDGAVGYLSSDTPAADLKKLDVK